jgi:hypothetical protein
MPLTRVFSFGSNSVAQLRARVQTKHLESEPAIVHDWVRMRTLVFPHHKCQPVSNTRNSLLHRLT